MMVGMRKRPGSWAEQRRTYVLAPYQRVTDHRTGHSEADPQAVLDGDIDGFIEAGIRMRAAQRKDQQEAEEAAGE